MNLDFFNELKNNLMRNNEVNNFINDLADYLKSFTKRIENESKELNELRQEDCLYCVIDVTKDSVYLQNLNIDVVFEEVNLSERVKEEINVDTILRYKNGEYFIEEKLTEDFLNSMISIQEYKKIQKDFIEESQIEKRNPNTRYKVLSQQGNYTVLYSLDERDNTVKVPNELLPYNVNNKKVFYYENGKFKTDTNKTLHQVYKT